MLNRLFLACYPLLAAGLSSPASAAFRQLTREHGPHYAWSPAIVSQFLSRAAFPPRAVSIFEEQSVDGSILLELDDRTLTLMGVPPVDARRYHLLVKALEDEFDDGGIWQRDLFEIRAYKRGEFYALFFCGALSPLTALVLIHNEQARWDRWYGGSEQAVPASFFDLRTALLAPAWTLWQYLAPFFDTNPTVVVLLAVILALHQLLHCLRLIFGVLWWVSAGRHARTARDFGYIFILDPLIVCACTAAFRYALFPLIPRAVMDAIFYPALLICPLLPASMLWLDRRVLLAACSVAHESALSMRGSCGRSGVEGVVNSRTYAQNPALSDSKKGD